MARRENTLAARWDAPQHRLRRGLRPWAFELRLAFALALSLLLVFGAGQFVMSHALSDALIKRESQRHFVDARGVEREYAAVPAGFSRRPALLRAVSLLERLPGIVTVRLVGPDRTVVAASDGWALGERHDGTAVVAALARGARHAGIVSTPGDKDRLEFVEPVMLDGRRYALELKGDDVALRQQVAAARNGVAWVSGLGLLVAFGIFYLLAGRALSRRHRNVLRRATQDPLTGLGNHRAFQEELQRAQSFAARRGVPFAVVLVDLHDFASVNDRHGYRRGDELLIDVARALSAGRREDRAFRIGGDEFALILLGTNAHGAAALLERVLDKLDAAVTVGVAAAVPAPGDDPAVVREQADAALYEGKRAGGGCIVVFDDVRELLSVVTPGKVRALRSLLDEPRVDVVYQPIWRLQEGRVLGYEALARPRGYGFDGPADAFTVAEKTGRAHELDNVCRAAALLGAAELPDGALLFLNVHPQTLDHDALDAERLLRAVEAAGLSPERIVLEVTERWHARLPQVIAGVARLRALGFRIAIDDVGSGNSGLETLRHLPVDFLKVDRSIIAGAAANTGARAVLAAIAAFAGSTSTAVIAEGIENDEILDVVRTHTPAIAGAQGYLLGRPAPGFALPEAVTV